LYERERKQRRNWYESFLFIVLFILTFLLQVRLCHIILDLELSPLKHILLGVLEQLKLKDPADIFAEPVPLDEVGN